MYSIEVNELTKRFGKFTSVDHVSFKVKQGEVFGFLGANGAGKTTTIKMLCGILQPSEGDALVGGYSVRNEPDKVKMNIGYMSQKFSLYNDLTVVENINFFGGVYGLEGKSFEERKKWVLEISNLKGKETILTGDLPGGIKQRLALGTAVIHRPNIVFLDEPTSGVDPISRRNFWDLINVLSESGTTVFVTTHYLEEAEYCGNIVLLAAGKVIAEGNSQYLKESFIKTPIYEIDCENAVSVMTMLQRQKFTKDVSLFGNKIHLFVKDTDTKESDLREFLDSESVAVSSIDRIVPTLEDVFIHLLEEQS